MVYRKIRNKKIILPILFGILIGSFLVGNFVLALETGLSYGTLTGLGAQDIRVTAMSIIRVVLGFLGVIALAIIIYAGYTWMTAAGNVEKISLAKKILVNAVIGLVIIFSAFMISSFIIDNLIKITGAGPGGSSGCTPNACTGCHNICNSEGTGSSYTDSQCGEEIYCTITVLTCPKPETPLPKICKIEATRGTGLGGIPQGASGDYITIEGWYFGNYLAGTSKVKFGTAEASIVQCSGSPVWNERADNYSLVRVQAPTLPPANYGVTVTNANNEVSGSFAFAIVQTTVTKPGLACIVPGSGVNAQNLIKAEGIRFGADPSTTTESSDGLYFSLNQPATSYTGWEDSLITSPQVPPTAVSGYVSVKDVSNQESNKIWFAISCQQNSDCPSTCCQGFSCRPLEYCLAEIGESCDNQTASPACEPNEDLCQPGLRCDNTSCLCRLPVAGENCDTSEEAACQPGNCADDRICFADNVNCTCQDVPMINLISPDNGAAGNLITINGKYFGAQSGQVYFADATGNPTVLAQLANEVNSNCTAAWSDSEIIVAVPSGAASGPIKVVRRVSLNGLADQTNDSRGPLINNFQINSIGRPGLCLIDPPAGQVGTNLILEGVRLFSVGTSTKVFFGNELSGGTVSLTGLTRITGVTVPSFSAGLVGVRVKVGDEFSNPKSFQVESGTGPSEFECSSSNLECNPTQTCGVGKWCNSQCQCETLVACDNNNFSDNQCNPTQTNCSNGYYCFNPSVHGSDPLKSACYCYPSFGCDGDTQTPICEADNGKCPQGYFCDSSSNCTCQAGTGSLVLEGAYVWSFRTGSNPGACSKDPGVCLPDDTLCESGFKCNLDLCQCEKISEPVCTPNDAALLFDSQAGNYIGVADSDSLDAGTGDISVSTWFKHSTADATDWGDYLVNKMTMDNCTTNPREGYTLVLFRNRNNPTAGNLNKISFTVGAGAGCGAGVYSQNTYNDNQWHHTVGVAHRSGSTLNLKLYIDGVLDNQANFTIAAAVNNDNSESLRIGRGYGDIDVNQYWNGLIDDLAIYKRALDQSEVLALYQNRNFSSSNDQLSGYWRFNNDLNDQTGANNGAMVGTVSYAIGHNPCSDLITCDGNTGNNVCDPSQPMCPSGYYCYNPLPGEDFDKKPCSCYPALSCDGNPSTPACDLGSNCPINYSCDPSKNCTCQPATGLPTESAYLWSFRTGQAPGPCSKDPGVCEPDDTRCTSNQICDTTTCFCKSLGFECSSQALSCAPDNTKCQLDEFCDTQCQCQALIPCDNNSGDPICNPNQDMCSIGQCSVSGASCRRWFGTCANDQLKTCSLKGTCSANGTECLVGDPNPVADCGTCQTNTPLPSGCNECVSDCPTGEICTDNNLTQYSCYNLYPGDDGYDSSKLPCYCYPGIRCDNPAKPAYYKNDNILFSENFNGISTTPEQDPDLAGVAEPFANTAWADWKNFILNCVTGFMADCTDLAPWYSRGSGGYVTPGDPAGTEQGFIYIKGNAGKSAIMKQGNNFNYDHYIVKAKIKVRDSGTSLTNNAGLIFGYKDQNNYWLWEWVALGYQSGTYGADFQKFAISNKEGYLTKTPTRVANDQSWHEIKVEVVNTSNRAVITGYLDGNKLLSYNANSRIEGNAGVYGWDADASVSFDNIEISSTGELVCHPDDTMCPTGYVCDPQSSCFCKPGLGLPDASSYNWSFSTFYFGPQVVEMCNRSSDCNPDAITSPSPFNRDATNLANYRVGPARPDDGAVPIDAVISARFTEKMYLPSLTDANIILYDCGPVAGNFNNSSCTTVVAKTLTIEECNYRDQNEVDANCFAAKPNNLLVTNHWYQVVLKSRSIFGQNGVRLAGNEIGGDYRWVFKTRESDLLSQVACLYINPRNSTLYGYDSRQSYNTSISPLDFVCIDIRDESCNAPTPYNWATSDPAPAETGGGIRAYIVPDGGHQNNPPQDCSNSSSDSCAQAAAHADSLKDTPPYTNIDAACNFVTDDGTVSTVGSQSNLTVDFSSPYVIDRFPDCGTACLNSKIGATFSRVMDTTASFAVPGHMRLYICYDDPNCLISAANLVSTFNSSVMLDPAENANTYTGYVPCYDYNGDGKFDYCLLPNTYYRVVIDGNVRSADEQRSLAGLNFDFNDDQTNDSYSWIFKTQAGYGMCLPNKINVTPESWQSDYNQTINYSAQPITAPDSCDPANGQRLNPYSYNWDWDTNLTPNKFSNPFCTGREIANFLSSSSTLMYYCPQQSAGTNILRDSCGNGVIESGENCDDGNLVNSDGCSSDCLNEGSVGSADYKVLLAESFNQITNITNTKSETPYVGTIYTDYQNFDLACFGQGQWCDGRSGWGATGNSGFDGTGAVYAYSNTGKSAIMKKNFNINKDHYIIKAKVKVSADIDAGINDIGLVFGEKDLNNYLVFTWTSISYPIPSSQYCRFALADPKIADLGNTQGYIVKTVNTVTNDGNWHGIAVEVVNGEGSAIVYGYFDTNNNGVFETSEKILTHQVNSRIEGNAGLYAWDADSVSLFDDFEVGYYESTGSEISSCGNGTIEKSESCDDGNLVSDPAHGDYCNNNCLWVGNTNYTTQVCGNGIIEATEECDPPGSSGCGSNCMYKGTEIGLPGCGDGQLQPGEECDTGSLRYKHCEHSVAQECTEASDCGAYDCILGPADMEDGDFCTNKCLISSAARPSLSFCRDSVTNKFIFGQWPVSFSGCNGDGDTYCKNTYGETYRCVALNTATGNTTISGSVCGNGQVELGEECDTGGWCKGSSGSAPVLDEYGYPKYCNSFGSFCGDGESCMVYNGRCSIGHAPCGTLSQACSTTGKCVNGYCMAGGDSYYTGCTDDQACVVGNGTPINGVAQTGICLRSGCSDHCIKNGSVQEVVDPPYTGAYQVAQTFAKPGQTYMQAWIKEKMPTQGPLGQGYLQVGNIIPDGSFGIIDRWPDCSTTCINASIGGQFNTSTNPLTLTPNNIKLFECGLDEVCEMSSAVAVDSITVTVGTGPNGEADVTFNIILPSTYNLVDINEDGILEGSTLKPNTTYRVVVLDQVSSKGPDKLPWWGLNLDFNGDEKIDSYSWVFKTQASPSLCTIGHVQIIPTTLRVPGGLLLQYFSQPWSAADYCDPLNGQRINPYFYDWRWEVNHLVSGVIASEMITPLRKLCGNGMTEIGEDCDDGNLIAGDGCSGICLHAPMSLADCGNSIINIGEECDPANGTNCSSSCLWSGSTAAGKVCANGQIELGEECEDGGWCQNENNQWVNCLTTNQTNCREESSCMAYNGYCAEASDLGPVPCNSTATCTNLGLGNCVLDGCNNECLHSGSVTNGERIGPYQYVKTNRVYLSVADEVKEEIQAWHNLQPEIIGIGELTVIGEANVPFAVIGHQPPHDPALDNLQCRNAAVYAVFSQQLDIDTVVGTCRDTYVCASDPSINCTSRYNGNPISDNDKCPKNDCILNQSCWADSGCYEANDKCQFNNFILEKCGQGLGGAPGYAGCTANPDAYLNKIKSLNYKIVPGICNVSHHCEYNLLGQTYTVADSTCKYDSSCIGSQVTVTGMENDFLDSWSSYQLFVRADNPGTSGLDGVISINGNSLTRQVCSLATDVNCTTWNFSTNNDFCHCDYVGVGINPTSSGNETTNDLFTCAGDNCGSATVSKLDDDIFPRYLCASGLRTGMVCSKAEAASKECPNEDGATFSSCTSATSGILVGNQHLYQAMCYDVNNPTDSRIPLSPNGINFVWTDFDPDNLIYLNDYALGYCSNNFTTKCNLAADCGAGNECIADEYNDYYLVTPGEEPATPKGKNGESIVNVISKEKTCESTGQFCLTDSNCPAGKKCLAEIAGSQVVNVTNFICDNPWPDLVNFPYQDNDSNFKLPDTNFKMYYCRDFGNPGFSDDLPPLSLPGIVLGKSDSIKSLKEFIFPAGFSGVETQAEVASKSGVEYDSNRTACFCGNNTTACTSHLPDPSIFVDLDENESYCCGYQPGVSDSLGCSASPWANLWQEGGQGTPFWVYNFAVAQDSYYALKLTARGTQDLSNLGYCDSNGDGMLMNSGENTACDLNQPNSCANGVSCIRVTQVFEIYVDGVSLGKIINSATLDLQNGELDLGRLTTGNHTVKIRWINDWGDWSNPTNAKDSNVIINRVSLLKIEGQSVNSNDALGIKVLSNPLHLSPMTWYKSGLCGGVSDAANICFTDADCNKSNLILNNSFETGVGNQVIGYCVNGDLFNGVINSWRIHCSTNPTYPDTALKAGLEYKSAAARTGSLGVRLSITDPAVTGEGWGAELTSDWNKYNLPAGSYVLSGYIRSGQKVALGAVNANDTTYPLICANANCLFNSRGGAVCSKELKPDTWEKLTCNFVLGKPTNVQMIVTGLNTAGYVDIDDLQLIGSCQMNLPTKGTPKAIIIDGYQAVEDGRTVYVGAPNLTIDTSGNDNLFSNIYLISYSQNASSQMKEIFGRILDQKQQNGVWSFNTNFSNYRICGNVGYYEGTNILCGSSEISPYTAIGDSQNQYCGSFTAPVTCQSTENAKYGCHWSNDFATCLAKPCYPIYCSNNFDCPNLNCLADKEKVVRDSKRYGDLRDTQLVLKNYFAGKSVYPLLSGGTYIASTTFSVWPSWQQTFATGLSTNLPIDPLNRFGKCGQFYCDANQDGIIGDNEKLTACTPGQITDCDNNPSLCLPQDAEWQTTCWNEISKQFSCPVEMSVYAYKAVDNGSLYGLYANFEYSGQGNWRSAQPFELPAACTDLNFEIHQATVGGGMSDPECTIKRCYGGANNPATDDCTAGGIDSCPDKTSGTACLADADNDSVCDYVSATIINDNCNPATSCAGNPAECYNPNQRDTNGNGAGDICDSVCSGDADNDGVCDNEDNCLTVYNPTPQLDKDDDGYGDACDPCTDIDRDNYWDVNTGANDAAICPKDNCPAGYCTSGATPPTGCYANSQCPGGECQFDSTFSENPVSARRFLAIDHFGYCTDANGNPVASKTCCLAGGNYNIGVCANDGGTVPLCTASSCLGQDFYTYNPYQEDYDNDQIGYICDDCIDFDKDSFGDYSFYTKNPNPSLVNNLSSNQKQHFQGCQASQTHYDNFSPSAGNTNDLDNCPGGPNGAECYDRFGIEISCINVNQADVNGNEIGDICDLCGDKKLGTGESCDCGATEPYTESPNNPFSCTTANNEECSLSSTVYNAKCNWCFNCQEIRTVWAEKYCGNGLVDSPYEICDCGDSQYWSSNPGGPAFGVNNFACNTANSVRPQTAYGAPQALWCNGCNTVEEWGTGGGCGDGIVQSPQEDCDPPNGVTCGDGTTGENCKYINYCPPFRTTPLGFTGGASAVTLTPVDSDSQLISSVVCGDGGVTRDNKISSDIEIGGIAPTLDIVFVNDFSGSMDDSLGGTTKIEALKTAVKNSVNNIFTVFPNANISFSYFRAPSNDCYVGSLLDFVCDPSISPGGGTCPYNGPALTHYANKNTSGTGPEWTGDGQDYLNWLVDNHFSRYTNGGTPLTQGLQIGRDIASKMPGTIKILILLSDGRPEDNNCPASGSGDTINKSIAEGQLACSSGEIIYSVGLTDDATLVSGLNQVSHNNCPGVGIATCGNNNYCYATSNASQLGNLYNRIIDDIREKITARFQLSVGGSGTPFTLAYGINGESKIYTNQLINVPSNFCESATHSITLNGLATGQTVRLFNTVLSYCPAGAIGSPECPDSLDASWVCTSPSSCTAPSCSDVTVYCTKGGQGCEKTVACANRANDGCCGGSENFSTERSCSLKYGDKFALKIIDDSNNRWLKVSDIDNGLFCSELPLAVHSGDSGEIFKFIGIDTVSGEVKIGNHACIRTSAEPFGSDNIFVRGFDGSDSFMHVSGSNCGTDDNSWEKFEILSNTGAASGNSIKCGDIVTLKLTKSGKYARMDLNTLLNCYENVVRVDNSGVPNYTGQFIITNEDGACPAIFDPGELDGCGDGACNPVDENCGNCSQDCQCPAGKVCSENVCIVQEESGLVTYYADSDSDGSFSNQPSTCAQQVGQPDCRPAVYQETVGGDCNDVDPNINPSEAEICTNSLDDNCNGYADCDDFFCAGKTGPSSVICCWKNGATGGEKDDSLCPACYRCGLTDVNTHYCQVQPNAPEGNLCSGTCTLCAGGNCVNRTTAYGLETECAGACQSCVDGEGGLCVNAYEGSQDNTGPQICTTGYQICHDGSCLTSAVCTPGIRRNCSNQTGVCAGSQETCSALGQWSGCDYTLLAGYHSPETGYCADGLDNDCDNLADSSDSDCFACTPGSQRSCANQAGVCAGSQETCTAAGQWPGCNYSALANYHASEIGYCADSLDNNCDSQADCADATCAGQTGLGGDICCQAAVDCMAFAPGNCSISACNNNICSYSASAPGVICQGNCTQCNPTTFLCEPYAFGCSGCGSCQGGGTNFSCQPNDNLCSAVCSECNDSFTCAPINGYQEDLNGAAQCHDTIGCIGGSCVCEDINQCISASDSDSDGQVDNVDPCPYDPNNDSDGDGICVVGCSRIVASPSSTCTIDTGKGMTVCYTNGYICAGGSTNDVVYDSCLGGPEGSCTADNSCLFLFGADDYLNTYLNGSFLTGNIYLPVGYKQKGEIIGGSGKNGDASYTFPYPAGKGTKIYFYPAGLGLSVGSTNVLAFEAQTTAITRQIRGVFANFDGTGLCSVFAITPQKTNSYNVASAPQDLNSLPNQCYTINDGDLAAPPSNWNTVTFTPAAPNWKTSQSGNPSTAAVSSLYRAIFTNPWPVWGDYRVSGASIYTSTSHTYCRKLFTLP